MGDARSRRRRGLAGRVAECRALTEALADATAADGGFGCVLLVGEAGVGKSRLAEAFAAQQAGAATVLSARAHRLGATASLGVWIEAFDRELRGRSPADVRRLCGAVEADLAGVLRTVDGARTDAARSPARVLDAFAHLLRGLAAERPVLIVIDDLQLADVTSLVALHHLAHVCVDERVLVIATARPGELTASPDAVHAVVRLEQDGLAHRVVVAPLDVDGVRELAAQVVRDVPDVLVDWLFERSRGLPLDALDLLEALVEEGADLHRPVLRRLPDSLSDRVALRMHALDPAAVAVVELLAVLGRRAELRGLVALSGRPPAELVDVVERLVRARLVVEHEDGPELTVEIAHPLVADAVYAQLGTARRRLLHREVARELQSWGRLGEASGHFARSADPGDDEAVAALCAAVRSAEGSGAFREALSVLDALVRLLPAGDPRWSEVVDALDWDAQWVLDHRADSRSAVAVPALRLMDAALVGIGSPGRRATVKLRLANFLGWGTGTLTEAQEMCRAAEALFREAHDERGRLLAAHELAWLRGYDGDIALLEDEARAVAEEALRVGDEFVRIRAVRTVALMAVFRGRPAEAEAAFQEVAGPARRAGDLHRQALAAVGLTMSALLLGRPGDAVETIKRGYLADAGAADYVAIAGWWSGDIAAVRAVTREVAGIGPTPASRRLGVGLFFAALAAIEVGANAEARRYAGRLRELYDDRSWAMHATMAVHVDAVAEWREGRPEKAIPVLHEAAAILLRGDFIVQAVPLLVDLAEITGWSRTDDPYAAAELERIAERTGLPGYHGLALIAAAWHAYGQDDRAATHDLATRAAAFLDGWPLHLARSLYLVGLIERDRDEAVTALREAATLFEGCGATVRSQEALAVLGKLGSRGRRAAAAGGGAAALTSREREVAELAAAGWSARDIGAELFIGERTVEGHLARTYARLGVRSKVELVARAGELGLRPRTGSRTGTPDTSPRRS